MTATEKAEILAEVLMVALDENEEDGGKTFLSEPLRLYILETFDALGITYAKECPHCGERMPFAVHTCEQAA